MVVAEGRPTVAEVSLGALRHNCREAVRVAGDDVRVMAVVKADAYGHGAVRAARAFLDGGASMLGVSTVAEGAELRDAGIDVGILVLWGAFDGEAGEVARCGLEVAVWSAAAIDALGVAGVAAGRSVALHLKVETGMTRLGVAPADLVDLARHAEQTPGVEVRGVFSHLASAEAVESPPVQVQIRLFEDAVGALRAAGVTPRDVHLANSAALLCQPKAHWSMVRPGIMLYGYPPAPHLGLRVALQPALRLVSRIELVRDVPAGTAVGYGGSFVADRPTRIAVLPIGYADGYHRLASNRADVVVRGRLAPIAGRVCMDHVMVDVTDVPGAGVGDRAQLIGAEGPQAVWADTLGLWCETIPYEMVTGVGRRVPRVYMEDFDG